MRKVAFFVGDIFGEYEREVMSTLIEEGKKKDIIFYVFSNYGGFSSNGLQSLGEKKVIRIPNLADYDGILVAQDTFAIVGMYEELKDAISEQANCPVISLRVEDKDYYSIVIDNYHAMFDMVEHFIVQHGCKHICFMAGTMNLQDAHERLQGYQDAMQKHGLSVKDNMIFYGDYWRNKGIQALEQFMHTGEKIDAIICSNDYMAMSILENLSAFGLECPKDVLVAGFDDTLEAKATVPPLTTVQTCPGTFGKKAIAILENVWNGNEQNKLELLGLKPVFRASCGCNTAQDMSVFRLLFENQATLIRYINHNAFMGYDFDGAENFEELVSTAYAYMIDMSYRGLTICLCDKEEERTNKAEMLGKYTKHMIVRAHVTPTSKEFLNQKFLRRDVLPKEFYDENMPLYIFPLHARGRCYGYAVFQTDDLAHLGYFFRAWKFSFSSALERIQNYAENQDLEKFRKEAFADDMTGIANRRAMDHTLRTYFRQMEQEGYSICVISLDLDGLKTINDTYGHLAGDDAIRTFAKILQNCSSKNNAFASRVGGDEFLTAIQTEDEDQVKTLLLEIEAGIQMVNASKEKPYTLSVSMGYQFCRPGDTLADCIDTSDKKMYQNKNDKKLRLQ